MSVTGFTTTQQQRLKKLGINPQDLPAAFTDSAARNSFFQKLEKEQIQNARNQLTEILNRGGRVALEELSHQLTETLCGNGFTRVTTPTVISKSALAKMTVDDNHPLSDQIFWLGNNQCLRPMLAPNLYSLMSDFSRLNRRPIRFFEIGSCFRKESDGAKHNTEFTMLNLVEMGTPTEERLDRLKDLAHLVVRTAGLKDYEFEEEESVVYGTTLDVVAGNERVEVASGAVGPHPLDIAWKISDNWVGLGFGLERLLMVKAGDTSIARWGKNTSYLSGVRLSL